MTLSIDDTNLGMLLPIRAGHSLEEYHRAVLRNFPKVITDHIPEHLCTSPVADVMLFSSDEKDEGYHFHFRGCDQGGLVFSPNGDILADQYETTLFFFGK